MERQTDAFEMFQSAINAAGSSTGRTREDVMLEMIAVLLKRTEEPKVIFHAEADFTKTIGYINGGKGGVAAEEWLEKLDSTKTMRNWPDNIILEHARSLLINGGRDWYDMKQQNLKSWDDFKKHFRKAFILSGENLTAKWERMRKRKQLKSEDANAYFHSKTKLCQALHMSFEETKQQVLNGLLDKQLYGILAAEKHTDYDELGTSILKHESALNDLKFGSCEGSQTRYAPTTKVKCEVKEEGEQTRKREVKCYRCRKVGHFLRDCPERNKKKTETDTKNSSGEVKCIMDQKDQTGNKYIKSVTIEDKKFMAMVDAGSSVCTIKTSLVNKEEYRVVQRPMMIKSWGPENFKLESPAAIMVTMEVDGVMAKDVPVRIVPDDAQTVDVIIGLSFTELAHVYYTTENGKLTFMYNRDYPFANMEVECAVQKLRTTSEMTLPPETINLVQVTDEQTELTVPVLNLSHEPVLLPKETTILTGQVGTISSQTKPEMEPIVEADLNIGEQPREVIKELIIILNNFRSCISKNIWELGLTSSMTIDIKEIAGSRPVRAKPYRASNTERQEISRIVEELREAGIVTDTESPYASPVLLTKKKTGESRMVVDYRALNRQTERMNFPLPNMDDHLALLANSNMFIVLDLAHGYFQVPLTKEAMEKTAFITPDETGQFTRMVFGLMNAPFYFSFPFG
ncbi:uncharacterized protein LOC113372011 [Ctenocephalides felis]|uniref:uncharacterized protein LOC113372011 n=1 Tax=Ctenocephalides felis TaxID=7515 RepID=UPI000E6E5166|nr:uncharacterized protein LOC113372011 [Ctenocephalides felis]